MLEAPNSHTLATWDGLWFYVASPARTKPASIRQVTPWASSRVSVRPPTNQHCLDRRDAQLAVAGRGLQWATFGW